MNSGCKSHRCKSPGPVGVQYVSFRESVDTGGLLYWTVPRSEKAVSAARVCERSPKAIALPIRLYNGPVLWMRLLFNNIWTLIPFGWKQLRGPSSCTVSKRLLVPSKRP